ncbi:OVARIAN TUMOR DOMAIN-containing deubiquitinating enzyme 11 isoform X2 [Rhodamnia argentea]|uniref:ubiquitinyl hydrolase 1 n=1 Tax=Rhodamnia argentea TaxID=178133 RepID=A0A8B8QJ74_9MYRT|nr:OVARIAN TUMOR DOMAIN-containing deubiquitinating enzyme 11 isoform X2 [Rhodamnia argentea]
MNRCACRSCLLSSCAPFGMLDTVRNSVVGVLFKLMRRVFLAIRMTESCSNASPSSSSSLNSSFRDDTEDDQTIAAILAEEESSKSDGKLGKRLSHLDSIPHTPRVIGEIPDVNEATLDHERLSERLATYDLEELQIEGDGNCQFRALADQLFGNSDHHKIVRKEIIKQLKHERKLYEGYVPMKYKSYLKKMKKSGEWGDHVTLQAAADRFVAKINLVTSFKETSYIEIVPNGKNPTKELWLSFWSEVHYNSLYETGDVPARKPRKKHWLF